MTFSRYECDDGNCERSFDTRGQLRLVMIILCLVIDILRTTIAGTSRFTPSPFDAQFAKEALRPALI